MKYIINESQYVYLLENLEKNKRFLKNKLGIDFTDKIQQITSTYDFPMEFDQGVSPEMVRRYLNHFGPMYLFELDVKNTFIKIEVIMIFLWMRRGLTMLMMKSPRNLELIL